MISNFFNYASMNPVKTILIGVGVALATPYVLPWLMPSIVAPAASIAHLFSLLAMGTGAVHTVKNVGPIANSATANGGKIALGGLGVGVAAPYVVPLLGSLGAPTLALASIFAPAALLVGGALMAVHLAKPLFRPSAPKHA